MEIDLREALRYAGVPTPDAAMLEKMQSIADRLTAAVQPRSVYRLCSLVRTERGYLLPEANVELTGASAKRMLESCDRAALLVCTLGTGFDAMLRTWQHRDMADAVLLDACGSAYVEAACNGLETTIAAACPGCYLTDRFSPGYGDLPLELQPSILSALNAMRRVGVVALNSMLMNPSKSVTAVIGLSNRPQQARIRGCAYCRLANQCTLRKRGDSCGA